MTQTSERRPRAKVKQDPVVRDRKRFLLRIDAKLFDELYSIASSRNVTMNYLIQELLSHAVASPATLAAMPSKG